MVLGDLQFGRILTNRELRELFHVGIYGGIRISKRLNAIVLVADFRSQIYSDLWYGNVLRFVAASQYGDQRLSEFRNDALINASEEGRSVYLFQKFAKNENVYSGIVEVLGRPRKARAKDFDGDDRSIFYFNLRPLRKAIDRRAYRQTFDIDVTINDSAEAWPRYFMERLKGGLHLDIAAQQRLERIQAALWREYAVRQVEIFLTAFDGTAKSKDLAVLVPYYDLSEGTISAKITIAAAVFSIAGAMVEITADYPQARANVPILISDVISVMHTAADSVRKRLGQINIKTQGVPPPKILSHVPDLAPPRKDEPGEWDTPRLPPPKR